MDVTNENSKEIEMDELVIVGSRYSKDFNDRLLPIYEKGDPMSAEELGQLLGGMSLVISPDLVNQYDSCALDVRTKDNKFLGRVWWYQSFALSGWMENQNEECVKARIKRVNTKYGLIFAEVRGLKLKCHVRENYSVDTDWACCIPDRLPFSGGSSLDVSMFLLRECLLEKNIDLKQLRQCFDNLLQDLPTDLSAQYYVKCMELNQLMKESPIAEVREMRDLLLHTFVDRGSETKMELWVNKCLPELFRDAAESDVLAMFEAANYSLERVEELLGRAPENLFYLYQVNRVRFAFQLYYLALPKELYNSLLTLLVVREMMQLKKKQKAENPFRKEETCDEELFHFIHPEIEEEEAIRIHQAIKRAVAYLKAPEICAYLTELKLKGKVMLPPSPSIMYNELVRLGMPTGKGFSEKYFSSCYIK